MCGIAGYLGPKDAVKVVLGALKRLEYRGYDSAGIAVHDGKNIRIIKRKGKLSALEEELEGVKVEGHLAVGHTRWATHGRPSDINAHPHRSGKIVVVHNGIVENYRELKEELADEFVSETDTEVIAALINHFYLGDLLDAVLRAVDRLKGSYAIVVLADDRPQQMVAYRKDSPLVLGVGEDEFIVASDIPAVLDHTREVVVLEDGEAVVVEPSGYTIYRGGRVVEKMPEPVLWTPAQAEKAGYRHFMQKEIFEQPRAIADTVSGYLVLNDERVSFGLFEENGPIVGRLKEVDRVRLVACGTSYHACLVARYWFDRFARIPVEVEIASEFRYRDLPLFERDLCIFVSQSGETADTLAALRMCKRAGCLTLGVCNVMKSSIARESHGVVYTLAGPEIGVASTKAFTTQLVVLFLICVYLGLLRGVITEEEVLNLCEPLLFIPGLVEEVLKLDEDIKGLAGKFLNKEHFLYLGRHISYPVALEGALKLKEISYIHAEGYAAGEMKHGPIALIDEKMPVVVVAPKDRVYDKIRANIEEVKARSGVVIAFTDRGNHDLDALCDYLFYVPETVDYLTPLVYTVPLQLFAYHVAALKGCDVDQPRNLAKAVTVE